MEETALGGRWVDGAARVMSSMPRRCQVYGSVCVQSEKGVHRGREVTGDRRRGSDAPDERVLGRAGC